MDDFHHGRPFSHAGRASPSARCERRVEGYARPKLNVGEWRLKSRRPTSLAEIFYMVRHIDNLKIYGLVLIPLVAIFLAFNLRSDLFGPSDFRQCFLQEVKGLPKDLEGLAYAECQKRFPPVVASSTPIATKQTEEEIHVQFNECEENWGDNYAICVESVQPNYTLTRVEAVFFHRQGDHCENISNENWYKSDHWAGEKSWLKARYTFDEKSDPAICRVYAFYGLHN